MKASEFCYWLQGFFEVAQPETISEEQLKTIQDHLSLVFAHELDPKAGGAEVQEKLNTLHGGTALGGKESGEKFRC